MVVHRFALGRPGVVAMHISDEQGLQAGRLTHLESQDLVSGNPLGTPCQDTWSLKTLGGYRIEHPQPAPKLQHEAQKKSRSYRSGDSHRPAQGYTASALDQFLDSMVYWRNGNIRIAPAALTDPAFFVPIDLQASMRSVPLLRAAHDSLQPTVASVRSEAEMKRNQTFGQNEARILVSLGLG